EDRCQQFMKLKTLYIYRLPFAFQTLSQLARLFTQIMVAPSSKASEPVLFRIFPQAELTVTEQVATNFISQTPPQWVTLSKVFVAGVARDSRDIAAQVHDLISSRILF